MNDYPPSPDSTTTVDRQPSLATKHWLDDACLAEIDHFVKTLSDIPTKGVRPDLIGSIITHYACKWIPELSNEAATTTDHHPPPESATVSWLKKRFFTETIISVLPPEKDSIPCSFLLRLLKTANMVNTDLKHREQVETRVAWRLDQATVKELMIPCFSHVTGTLLDVQLMLRLVKKFVDNINNVEGVRSGAGLFRVAKLVDAYLAEAAVDSELGLPEFMELAGAVPAQARVTDDGLYRAIDTYLKTHVNLTKEERKSLCKLIDSQKLSIEASLHAAQNERLPVRSVIQVLFSEQAKLHSHINPSRQITNTKSPNRYGLDPSDRCHSSRDMMTLQQMEIKRLKEHVTKLERQCQLMQSQMDKLLEKKKGFFSWRRFATSTNLGAMSIEVAHERVEAKGYDSGTIGKQTPVKGKQGRGNTTTILTFSSDAFSSDD